MKQKLLTEAELCASAGRGLSWGQKPLLSALFELLGALGEGSGQEKDEGGWVRGLEGLSAASRRRKWQPTPVFLPGEPQRQRSLVGYRLWGRTELDTTEAT